MNKAENKRCAERGSAKTKLLIAICVLFLIGNAGLNYIPVAYESASFQQEMQTAVVQGLASPPRGPKPSDLVKMKLAKAARNNNLPDDYFMDVKQTGNNIQAHVYYTKPVNILPFGIYTYTYEFDHTVTPVGFLTKSD